MTMVGSDSASVESSCVGLKRKGQTVPRLIESRLA